VTGWHEASIARLQAAMAAGEITAGALVDVFLARIEALDRGGPALNAVIEINPDARAMAEALDRERQAGRVRGPLHGVPILLKDNIDTADRMMTTAGSLALVGAPSAQDATVAAQLRAAGAVLLGKTNLSEWANIRCRTSTSGWSGRHGQTRNPHVLDRNPSGSSSGSGVAVAAGLCVVSVGTETDGSIVSPANASGVVGIKPTVGLVSRAGIVPISHSQDTAGPRWSPPSPTRVIPPQRDPRPLTTPATSIPTAWPAHGLAWRAILALALAARRTGLWRRPCRRYVTPGRFWWTRRIFPPTPLPRARPSMKSCSTSSRLI
jgi:Asp-tRNA(Asn)/Glu-tRNA(Gln) amidotransferase A subunit family amidase